MLLAHKMWAQLAILAKLCSLKKQITENTEKWYIFLKNVHFSLKSILRLVTLPLRRWSPNILTKKCCYKEKRTSAFENPEKNHQLPEDGTQRPVGLFWWEYMRWNGLGKHSKENWKDILGPQIEKYFFPRQKIFFRFFKISKIFKI